jgi:putative ABC transport system ATP-binding protein
MSAEALLRARQVSRRDPANGNILLHPASFDLFAGDRAVVMGPTGSGKSLLLRALALLDPPEDGEVIWQGRPVQGAGMPAYRAAVAYVRQRPAMVEGTVEDNLRLPLTLAVYAGRPFDIDRARRLLAPFREPESFLKRLARDLSGGEAQLVAFTRALLLDPTVLLLDEPTAALDPETTVVVERVLLEWLAAATPRALMMVTHSPDQAARVATRHLRVEAGRLLPEAAATRARDEVVA